MSASSNPFHVIRDIVRNRMMQSGVDNYAFVDGLLKIGSKRYQVDACGCGEPGCDGVRLSPISHIPGATFNGTTGTA